MPRKIKNAHDLEKSGILKGDPVHIGVAGPGQATNDAIFAGRLVEGNDVVGIKITIRGAEKDVLWADLIEFWQLPTTLCLSEPQKVHRLDTYRDRIYGPEEP